MIADEAARLKALHAYHLLDTDPEQVFDDLTLLASQVCGTPIALITLVDENRQWFKSKVGIDIQETARNISFCAHAIQQPGLFVVPDTLTDGRFRDNPMVVNDPHIRFYAGASLLTRDGDPLGTICVIDSMPRTLTDGQRAALLALRRQAETQLELRRKLDELRVAIDGLEKLGGLLPYCSTCALNITIPADPAAMTTVSDGVTELLTSKGWPEDDVMKVELALQEGLANAIRHGCKGDPTKSVQCSVTFDVGGEVVIVIRDPGPGFNVSAVPNPLEGDNVLKPSGRGVFLINQLMDTVEFSDGGRRVLMRKRIEKDEPAK
ncbi:MAG: ATP-binding protein [Vicinamibacterales bacterium]|jgi:anti-sigma regulatory factor (Ser/Thr protein kinase)